MKSTVLNQKVNKDYNDSPVLAQTPETSSSTTTPSLPIIQIQQLIFNNTSWFLLSSDVDCLPA
jgi:hypothetical protein